MLAAVDLGSNSFRLHIGQHVDGEIRLVKSVRDPLHLAAGLDGDGNLGPAAMQRALACLAGFRAVLDAYPVEALRVVATNTIRIARNSAAFVAAAEAVLACPLEVISGEEEGRLVYLGVAHLASDPEECRLVIDMGGGSTELVLGCGAQIRQVQSCAIGTVGPAEKFFPAGLLTRAAFDAASAAAYALFASVAPAYLALGWQRAYGSSGSMRTVAEAIVHGGFGDGALSLTNMQALRDYCIQRGQISKLALGAMPPDRLTTMVSGLSVLLGAMTALQIGTLIPIEAGLRVGVMWDLHLRSQGLDIPHQ